MLTGVGNFLQNFDLIGKTVNFRIKESSHIKTSCGGISSIMIILGIIYIFFTFFIPFISGENPLIIFEYKKEIFPEKTLLKQDNFFLGVSVEYNDGSPIKDNPPIIEIIHYERYINDTTNYTNNKSVDLLKCDSNDENNKLFNSIMSNFTKNNKYFKIKCPGLSFVNFNFDQKYYLEGSPINPNNSFFEIKVRLNETKNLNLTIWQNLKLNIYYSDVSIDMKNSSFIPLYYLSFYTSEIGTDKFLSGSLTFMQYDLNIDRSYFADNNYPENKKYLIHFDTSYDTKFINPSRSDGSLCSMKLYKTKFTYKYYINFQKIPSLLTQSGGILNAFVTVIQMISFVLIDFQFYSNILNKTLDIDFTSLKTMKLTDTRTLNSNKENTDEKLKKFFQEIEFIKSDKKKTFFNKNSINIPNNENSSSNNNESFTNHNKDNTILNCLSPRNKNQRKYSNNNHMINLRRSQINNDASSERIDDMDHDKMNKMSNYMIAADKARKMKEGKRKKKQVEDDVFFIDGIFNFIDFVYHLFNCCMKIKPDTLENRYQLFEKSKRNFNKNFEVNNIIRKNIEIDLIKYLLMSTDQLNLYRLVKKPLISFQNKSLQAFDLAYEEFSNDQLYSLEELKTELQDRKRIEIAKSYNIINEKRQANVINRKLLRMVEDRISVILEENEKIL